MYGVELDGTKNPPEGSPTKRPIPGSSNKPQHSLSRHPSTSRQQSLNINFVGSNSDMQVDKLALSDGAILFSKMNKLEYEATSTTSGSNKTVSKDEVSPDSPKKVDVPAMMVKNT